MQDRIHQPYRLEACPCCRCFFRFPEPAASYGRGAQRRWPLRPAHYREPRPIRIFRRIRTPCGTIPPSRYSTPPSLEGSLRSNLLVFININDYCSSSNAVTPLPELPKISLRFTDIRSYLILRGQFWGGLLRRPLTSSKRSGRLLLKLQLWFSDTPETPAKHLLF